MIASNDRFCAMAHWRHSGALSECRLSTRIRQSVPMESAQMCVWCWPDRARAHCEAIRRLNGLLVTPRSALPVPRHRRPQCRGTARCSRASCDPTGAGLHVGSWSPESIGRTRSHRRTDLQTSKKVGVSKYKFQTKTLPGIAPDCPRRTSTLSSPHSASAAKPTPNTIWSASCHARRWPFFPAALRPPLSLPGRVRSGTYFFVKLHGPQGG